MTMSEKTAEAELFDEVVVDDSALIEVPEDKKKPTIGDSNWTEHMLSFLTEKEFRKHNDKQYPSTDGLRRLCSAKFGKVLRSVSTVVDPASASNNYTTTVAHELQVLQYGTDDVLYVV